MKHFDFIDYDTKGVGVFAEYSDDECHKVKTECRFDLKTAKNIARLANIKGNDKNESYLSNAELDEILKSAIFDIENGGYSGNKNAVKNEDAKSASFIHARCKQGDKTAWVKAAQSKNLKLTEWIVKTLNGAV